MDVLARLLSDSLQTADDLNTFDGSSGISEIDVLHEEETALRPLVTNLTVCVA